MRIETGISAWPSTVTQTQRGLGRHYADVRARIFASHRTVDPPAAEPPAAPRLEVKPPVKADISEPPVVEPWHREPASFLFLGETRVEQNKAGLSLAAKCLSDHDKIRLLIESIINLKTANECHTCLSKLCCVFSINKALVTGNTRQAYVVRVRHIGMSLSVRLRHGSMPAIGRVYGHKDHTTVLNALRKLGATVDAALSHYPNLRASG